MKLWTKLWIVGILLMAAPCRAQWDAPLLNSSSVLALGSDGRTVAPGSMIVITGDSLSLTSESSIDKLAETLAGVKVEVAQGATVRSVLLASVTPKRIVALLPMGLTGSTGELRVTHTLGTGKSSLRLAPTAPAVSSYTETSGGRAIAWHADGSPANETDAPLVPGETVTLRAYGLGELLASPSRAVAAKVEARLGAVALEVTGAEAAGSEQGVYLVRFVVPADLPPGWKALTLRAAGRDSEATQQIYVGPRYVSLVDAYPRGACEAVSTGQFMLETSAIVRQLWLRTRWLGGPATYTIERDGERLMTGTLFPREFEPGQSEWRGATSANIITASVAEFPAGLYSITLTNAELCALPETRARAGIRLSGSWTGSPWQPAESGVSVEGADAPPALLKMSGGSTEGRLSSYYKVEGLSANPSQPLVLKIDLDGTPPPEGAQLFLKSEANLAQAPMVLKGEVQEGKLVVTVPAAVQKTALRSAAGVSSMIMWVGLGMNNTDSIEGHFRVHYPSGEYELAKKIAAFLERTYTIVGAMGLDWTKRKNWPMDIYLFSYSSWSSYILGGSGADEGNTESDMWGNESVGLTLNLDTIKFGRSYLLNDAELTSGHELFHIMQTLYDTRGSLRKTFTHSSWLWLMEASATWLEKAISASADYQPLNAQDNWDFLFRNGLEVQAGYTGGAAARLHGYGASAFLQYLAPASPGTAPDSIGRVIARLAVEDSANLVLSSPGISPLSAIRSEFGTDLREKWFDFCDQYIQGAIWSGFPQMGVVLNGRNRPEPVTLRSKDLSAVRGWPAPDLSAKHFLLSFDPVDKPVAAAGDELTLKLNDPNHASKAFLYEVGTSGWIPWGSFTDQLTIAGAKDLIEAGTQFYVLIANGRCRAACTSSTPLEFTVKLGAPFAGVTTYTEERRLNHYNATYSSTVNVRITGSAPFQLRTGGVPLPSAIYLSLYTPPFDPTQPNAVDTFNINVTHKDIDFKNYKTSSPGESIVFVMGIPPGSLTERNSASVTIEVPRASRGRTVESHCSVRLKNTKGDLIEITGGADIPLFVSLYPYK